MSVYCAFTRFADSCADASHTSAGRASAEAEALEDSGACTAAVAQAAPEDRHGGNYQY